jgi:amino acid transporter
MAAIEENRTSKTTPKPTLTVIDAIAVIVGIVVGAGIFRTPSIVASNSGSETAFLLLWLIGGVISFIGGLCYAELSSAYPHTGGDYYYLTHAFGERVAFLYAWSRLTVAQTGSVAYLAFAFGDYATQIFPLGGVSSSIYAAFSVVFLTWLHANNIKQGTTTQKLLAAAKVLGLLCVIVVGLAFVAEPTTTNQTQTSVTLPGQALIFVLLTFGGWNEVAFVSGELKDAKRNMFRALLIGIGVITVIFLLTSYAYLKGLGLQGVAQSEAVASDLMRRAAGEGGAKFISVLIAIATLGSASVTIFTGARANFALGQRSGLFRYMGEWDEQTQTPRRALLVQGVISFLLILFGTWTRKGFETMVDYTAPVFWLFFMLTGISLILLRIKDKQTERPMRVPLYPLTPILFIATCAYTLYSSVVYVKAGAIAGVVVLLIGLPFMLAGNFRK